MLDTSKIRLREYDLYTESLGKVGYLVTAQTQARPGSQYIRVENAAQVRGVLKAWKAGDAPTLTTTMLQVDFEAVFGELGSGQFPVKTDTTTGNKSYGMGNKLIDMDNVAQFIRLHPIDAEDDDFGADIAFWKAAPDFSQITISGDRDNAQTVTIPWILMPDRSKSIDEQFGAAGDWTAVEGSPKGVFVQLTPNVTYPYKSVTGVNLSSGAVIQAYAYTFISVATSIVGAVDEAGDVSATAATFNIDGIPNTGVFNVGDYIEIGTELMEITGATNTGATSKTITVRRAIGGTAAASHLDDAVITLQAKVSVSRATEKATWASSDPTKATVGNSNSLFNKGKISHVATGSTDVTATVNTVASPNLAVAAQ